MHISSYLLLEAGGTWLANWCEGIFKVVKSYCMWLNLNKNYLKSEFFVTPFLLPLHQNLSFFHISLVMIPQSTQIYFKINACNSFIPNSILSFYIQLSNSSTYVISVFPRCVKPFVFTPFLLISFLSLEVRVQLFPMETLTYYLLYLLFTIMFYPISLII